MKNILLLFVLILSSCSEKFEKLSEKDSDRDILLKQIQPNKNIQYWQLEHFPNYKDDDKFSDVLYSFGKCTKTEKEKIPINKNDWNGFFSGCHPSLCAYRITFLENNEWKTVKSEEELKNFIGEINNKSEAFLIGIINGYSIDLYSEKGNGFLEIKNGFKIRMMKYESCPESKESFTFIVNKDGQITNLKSNGYYLKSKDCIVS